MRAWRGAVTPPIVTVTATGPASVDNGLVTHAGQQPVGGDRQFVRRAGRQDDAELVAGEAAEIVLAAQARADALGDLRDHFLGDIKAVGLVEVGEMVDGDQQEAQRSAKAHRFVEFGAEQGSHVHAIHFAGQGDRNSPAGRARCSRSWRSLIARTIPMRTHRLAVAAGEPTAGVLQPDLLAAAAAEGVLHLIGNAAACVAMTGSGDRVEAALSVFRFDLLRKAAAAGDVADVGTPNTDAALSLQRKASVSSRHS